MAIRKHIALRKDEKSGLSHFLMVHRNWLILLVFLVCMLWIHRYIFLYADDLYYSRDAQLGLEHFPRLLIKELNVNGRVWIAAAMLSILKPQIELFRIINPLVLLGTVIILAKICTFSEEAPKIKQDNPNYWIALLCGSLFFLFLPIEIARTTIYYAACAFNYLYPIALALLYSYLLYTIYSGQIFHGQKLNGHKESNSTQKINRAKKILLLAVGFLVGSSTQQVGMIGIGFMVLISFYLAFIRKKVLFRSFLPYYFVLFLGYVVVTYGSLKRLLLEQEAGKSVVILDVITELLKTNIFSLPAAPFVLLISLSSFFWLFNLSTKQKFNRLLAILQILSLIGYIYFLLYQKYTVQLSTENILTLYGLSISAFTIVYLFSLVYVSTQILIERKYPFLLFNSINAIGAQLMLIIVDARFAASYKIMFPSLVLLSVFILYSVIAFRKNLLFLSLAFLLTVLSIEQLSAILPASISFAVIVITLVFFLKRFHFPITHKRLFCMVTALLFIVLSFGKFSVNLYGYWSASAPQNYNLKAIEEYRVNSQNDVLYLKKVPATSYGYNLGNWNNMPYFMKQCYRISEDTEIRYLK